jgi:hypothetical protein
MLLILNFCLEACEEKRLYLEDLGVGGKIILKWKYIARVFAAFLWSRTETGGWLL